MILDATAGNQIMWKDKQNSNIIFIDVQKRLERKPTLFADNSNSPFRDKIFDTIFYDPPHAWNWDSIIFGSPDAESWNKKDGRKIPTYYGMERYNSRMELVAHIWKAQKEFYRILKDDGLLWLKWVEIKITLRIALTLFERWIELLRFHAKSPFQQAGNYKKFWLCLCKNLTIRTFQDRLVREKGGVLIPIKEVSM